MQSDELVRLVMDRLGAASADQLAERMGWRFNQVRTVPFPPPCPVGGHASVEPLVNTLVTSVTRVK